jgi:ABC-type sulfate transport system substrate-binding protein
MSRIRLVFACCAAALAAAATATAASINLVAYSTPKTVVGKIIQAWQATPDGAGVSFTQSYGASSSRPATT